MSLPLDLRGTLGARTRLLATSKILVASVFKFVLNQVLLPVPYIGVPVYRLGAALLLLQLNNAWARPVLDAM